MGARIVATDNPALKLCIRRGSHESAHLPASRNAPVIRAVEAAMVG